MGYCGLYRWLLHIGLETNPNTPYNFAALRDDLLLENGCNVSEYLYKQHTILSRMLQRLSVVRGLLERYTGGGSQFRGSR